MSSPVRAVLFDCDGVLQRASNDWRGELAALIGSPTDTGVRDAFFLDVRDAEMPTSNGSEAFTPALQRVLDRWHVRTPAAEALLIWQQVVVDPEMLDAARALTAAGIVCALATNQHAERAVYMRRTLGYEQTFDPCFFSCEVGLAKPDPAYFRHAAAELGLAPSQVLFVDDIARNVEGAREAGLLAEHFARDGGRPELDRVLALHRLAPAR